MHSRSHVFEVPTCNVAIQRVLAPISYEKVGVAVVVIISGTDTLAPTFARKTQLARCFPELCSAFVVIHPAWRARTRDNEDVQQTIVVVVDERHTAAGGLDDVLLRRRAAVGY